MTRRQRSESEESMGENTHPDFSKRSPGDFLLRANDGTGFYFPRDMLFTQSSFFRSLSNISVAVEVEAFPEIELNRAAPRIICFGLTLLRFVILGIGRQPKLLGVDDLLEFAHDYDFPIFPRLLFRLYESDMPCLWDRFSFAAISQDEAQIKKLYKRLASMPLPSRLDHSVKRMIRWVPGVWSNLNELYRLRQAAYIRLEPVLTAPGEGKGGDFSPKCAQEPNCVTHEHWKGNWEHLRSEVGSILWWELSIEKSRDQEQEWNPFVTLQAVLDKHITCQRCSRKLYNSWSPDFKDFFVACPDWDDCQ